MRLRCLWVVTVNGHLMNKPSGPAAFTTKSVAAEWAKQWITVPVKLVKLVPQP